MFTDPTSSFPNFYESNVSANESKVTKPHVVHESPSHSHIDVHLTEILDNKMATEEAQFEVDPLSPIPTAVEEITTVVKAPSSTTTQTKKVKATKNIHADALDMGDNHDLQHNMPVQGDWKMQMFQKTYKLKCDTLAFEREKLKFEREKFSKELKLRIQEMQWKWEMRRVEMEMKERIVMRELEIEEKVALN